jgi:hypothetical protein
MPTGPRQLPVGPQPDAAARRLHIHGIKEMPAGYDAEVAELFRDLRSATALTEMDLATRLGTRPDVVQALEQGALYALPPWAETCRVVNAYGALLNLDVRPLLRRIYAQLEAGIVELQPKAMPDVPVMTPPENGGFGFASGNAGAARPNPLDIPWPPPDAPPPRRQPQPQPAPQQSWQNAGAPPQAAPQASRPNAGYQPQPQNAWPQGQPHQPHPQGWPAAQPQAAARPGAPQAGRPAMPQPGQDRRPPQPRPVQGQPPQPQPAMPRQAPPPPPQYQPPPQPELQVDADFNVSPATPLAEPEAKPKRRRPALLKWALVALMLSVIGFGLWFALSHAPGTSGLQLPSSTSSDPDDPRSRKADRLPDASPPAPPAPDTTQPAPPAQ